MLATKITIKWFIGFGFGYAETTLRINGIDYDCYQIVVGFVRIIYGKSFKTIQDENN